MYIVIAGAGVVGRNLTRRLTENHDVVVIDLDREMCERVYSQYGAVSICGNATNINVLKEAGIKRCDIAVGVMRNDADNLAFALLAKNYNAKQIMVRMRDPEYKSAYKLAGATSIAGVMDLLVEEFVLDIEQPDIRKVYSLSGGKAEISVLTIPKGSWCDGRSISEIVKAKGFPEHILISGIFDQQEDRLIIPHGNTKVKELSQLFLVGTSENITQAAKVLLK
ncbi:trk system potassium uptake protein TrkA [Orenia metallireducens]|jgi:trk system potassium uptake protein TrkA|uniref:Trk system potassium uptake protein TrkA n=1 Tax=Orenia metallireducens TaxID=1413210 RepID=A0A285IE33_9FIRM|nr:NAD-binding protein [Orenia metallireducens]PRX20620.1 trk system potassium uptake protein TrkA [Orenia metallireducens]SNY45211.1 trk system potassium uptake protein TrkA [Orenia metallireducens]